jgi:hypothetical protein
MRIRRIPCRLYRFHYLRFGRGSASTSELCDEIRTSSIHFLSAAVSVTNEANWASLNSIVALSTCRPVNHASHATATSTHVHHDINRTIPLRLKDAIGRISQGLDSQTAKASLTYWLCQQDRNARLARSPAVEEEDRVGRMRPVGRVRLRATEAEFRAHNAKKVERKTQVAQQTPSIAGFERCWPLCDEGAAFQ